MYNQIFNQIEWCFDWRTDPANCFGAPAKMEEIGFWDEIDLNDDDDLAAMISLGLGHGYITTKHQQLFLR